MPSRPTTLTLTKSLLLVISYIPALHSRPTKFYPLKHDDFPEEDPASGAFWWKLGVSLILVLLGGVFAGTFYFE
jgi:metal transporter CNNM